MRSFEAQLRWHQRSVSQDDEMFVTITAKFSADFRTIPISDLSALSRNLPHDECSWCLPGSAHRRRLRCTEDLRPEGKRQLAFRCFWLSRTRNAYFAFQNVSSGWRRAQPARTQSAVAVQRLTACVCVRRWTDLSMDFAMDLYKA